MNRRIGKIVEFDRYCKKCKHCNKKESEPPCFDCLEECFTDTGRPVMFEKRKEVSK